MSKYCYAKISIGGQLLETEVAGLSEAFEQDDVTLLDIDIWQHNQTTPLRVDEEDVYYGVFKNVEAFCTAQGLSYLRQSAEVAGYSGEIVTNIPNRIDRVIRLDYGDDQPIIRATTLKELVAKRVPLREILASLEVPEVPPLKIAKVR